MGHTFISGTIEASSKKRLDEIIDHKRQQAGFESGWSYSGRINMLDNQMEYTKYMFHKDLAVDFTEYDLRDVWEDERAKYKKLLALKKKHNIQEELTLEDLIKRYNGKKIAAWKKWIIDYFWHAESDILYTIQTSARRFFYFGWPRC